MFGVLLLSYYIFLDFLSAGSMLWHTSCCHFTLICSFIIKHWLSWSNVFCCHGSFAWALFHFLLTLSPVIFHPAFTFTGPTSVCILSAGWGWLRELPLHAFITWAIFMWAAGLCSTGDERGLERCSRCVGSLWSCSVFFICLGHGPGLFSSFMLFPSLYLYTVGNVWYRLRFYSISRLLSLVWPLSALFLLLPAAVIPHLILQVVIMWEFLLSYSPDLPLNLSTYFFFYFRTPTSALHHFQPSFPGCSPPMIGLVGFFFCLHPSIPSSFMSSWAVMIICW